MRFKLNLDIEHRFFGSTLPINYQYELSAWIYSVIAKGDRQFAEWLHQNGFAEKHRNFKLFVFSNLYSPGIEFENDRLTFTSNRASFYLSFLPEKATEEFVKGIFEEQNFSIGDSVSKVQFRVRQIEVVPLPNFDDQAAFKTLSPVVVSLAQENKHPRYISPNEENYGQLLINNLKEKYRLFYNKNFSGEQYFHFELLSPFRSKLIRIKAGTKEETQVRGFVFKFMMKADKELLKVMYETGIGEKGSQGFGCVEVLNY